MMTTWLLPFLIAASLYVQGCLSSIVDVNPRDATVLPNQNVTFLCRMGVPLQYCRVEIPGIGTLNLNNKLEPTKGVSYYGAGLSAGQCGFTIQRVVEENNGQIMCYLGIETQSDEAIGKMHLTVARAPKPPELDLSKGTDSLRVYRINDMLQASCIVKDGRPVANISWFLDDEPIYEGLSMPTVLDFAKEDLHSKIQNLTRQLQATDNGRHLRCVASHPALLDGDANVAMRLLDVKYPPLPLTNPIDKFGFEIGKPGIISVEINANPKPRLEWTVREYKIREGSVDGTGRIEAEIAVDLGRGRYAANLRIAAINKQDTETQFLLTAYNDQGSQDYTVLISTSPEPEGLDLGVGSIIGVVVAVLILLLIVFIVVIARVKGRWCFSGGRSLETRRPVTENSDTESADVRPKEARQRKLPPLKLPKFLKKGGDKVTHKDEDVRPMETTPPVVDESKQQQASDKGLVYAELDLVSPNLKPVLKSDDDKTEYAEIVYTSEGENKDKDKATTAPS